MCDKHDHLALRMGRGDGHWVGWVGWLLLGGELVVVVGCWSWFLGDLVKWLYAHLYACTIPRVQRQGAGALDPVWILLG